MPPGPPGTLRSKDQNVTFGSPRHGGAEVGAGEHDRALAPVERLFAVMPLMHSEQLSDHDEAARQFSRILEAAEGADHETAEGFHKHELMHRGLIERFGRESTPEERVHVEGGGESFGQ
jgi:uncharacterized protein (DUF924 family)